MPHKKNFCSPNLFEANSLSLSTSDLELKSIRQEIQLQLAQTSILLMLFYLDEIFLTATRCIYKASAALVVEEGDLYTYYLIL